jgi:uncharacterized membrane protein
MPGRRQCRGDGGRTLARKRGLSHPCYVLCDRAEDQSAKYVRVVTGASPVRAERSSADSLTRVLMAMASTATGKSPTPRQGAKGRAVATSALVTLTVLYLCARFLQVFPGRVPMLAVVALHVLPAALFALIHGAMFYRLRGILSFMAICLVVGNVFENAGVRTGFPFGHYYFTDLMGPKLFAVPILLGLAYVGMSYLSWTLARVILRSANGRLSGSQVVTLPLLASFLMVAWDLSQDPVWATILHAWVWRHGGVYFGVPLSNFFGWYLTVYVIFQLFALYARGRPLNLDSLPYGYWHIAVAFYAISAAGNILLVIPHSGPSMVFDPAGVQWRVSDITWTCALMSICTMGVFALIAWIRLGAQRLEESGGNPALTD